MQLKLGLGLGAHRRAAAKLDPATVAYIQRVEADGGVVLSPQLVDAHIKAVKQIGITNAIYQLFASYAGIYIDHRGGVYYVTKMF